MSEATLALRLLLIDDSLSGLGALTGEMSGLMAGTLGAGVAFGLFAGATLEATDAGKDLEASLANMQLMVHGAADVMPQLTTAIIDLADHSTYSTAEVADAFSALGKHLITAQQIMDGVGKAAINMGLAMGVDAAGAADLLGQAMQVFGVQGYSASQVADMLDAAFHNGIPSVDGLRESIANAGGMAVSMGVKFDDFLAVMDLLAPRMGSASQAATSLRYVMAALGDPTDKQKKEMKDLGLITENAAGQINSSKFYDAKGNFIGLANAILLIQQSIQNLNPEQQAQALGQLFNVKSGQGIRTLLGALKDFGTEYATTKQHIDSISQAQKDADTRLATLAAHEKEFGTTLQDAWARIGITIIPPITQFIGKVNELVDSFNKASPQVHQAVAIFLLVGLVLSAIAVVVGAVAVLFATGLAPVAGIALAVAAGIAAVAAIVAGLWLGVQKLNDQFHISDAIMRAWNGVMKFLQPVIKEVGDFLGGVLAINLKIVGDAIHTQLIPAWNNLKQAFQQLQPVLQFIIPIFQFIAGVIIVEIIAGLGLLVSVIVAVIAGFMTLASGVITILSGLATFVSGVLTFIAGLFQLITGSIVLIVTGQFDKLGANAQQALNSMGKGIEGILRGLATMFVGILQSTLGVVIAVIGGFVTTAISWFQNLYHTLVGGSIIPDLMRGIASWFTRLPGMVAGGIASFISSVVSGMHNMASQVTSVVSNLIGQAASWGAHLVQNIASGIMGAAGAVAGAVGHIAGIIASVLHHTEPEEGPLAGDSQWGHHFVQNLVTGMNAGVPQVQASANKIAGAMGMVQSASVTGSGSAAVAPQALALYIDGKQIKDVVVKRMSGDLRSNGAARMYN